MLLITIILFYNDYLQIIIPTYVGLFRYLLMLGGFEFACISGAGVRTLIFSKVKPDAFGFIKGSHILCRNVGSDLYIETLMCKNLWHPFKFCNTEFYIFVSRVWYYHAIVWYNTTLWSMAQFNKTSEPVAQSFDVKICNKNLDLGWSLLIPVLF